MEGSRFMVIMVMVLCFSLLRFGATREDEELACMKVPGNEVTECVKLLARGYKIFCCDGLDAVDYTCLCTATGPLPGIPVPITLINMGGSCGLDLPQVCSQDEETS
ncbi:uncharacterized protein LOC127241014 [Andrographis paniculata]|uniref:uncharacterized protein LOC127241014 n=1 Tax=Andrographis paniculata TaxID=175694 RepID=UPI0021E763DC|nr:uncharacterized protein LOC127241014 [Andrographis paniculata]